MWKTHVFLLDMSLCLLLTLLLYNYKKTETYYIVNFMEIKACKGKIYLHRNLIKILDQRYCKNCHNW